MPEQTPISPWSTIWSNPRQTVRNVLATDPNRSMRLLIVGGGIGQACSFAASFGLGQTASIPDIFAFVLVFGPLAGFLSVLLWSWLLTWTSRWLGGTATRQQLRVAVAWSWAPVVYLLPLWGVRYILFRDELFLLKRPIIESYALLSGLYSFFGIVDFFVSFFSLFILFQAVAEVSSLSIWKSIGAIAAIMLLLTIPAILLFSVFSPM